MIEVRRITIGAVIMAFVIVGGCAMTPEQARMKSSYELCHGLLVYPSANIHQTARANELARRGENCAQFETAIRQQQQVAAERMQVQTAQKCANVLAAAERRAQTNCSGTFSGGYGQWNCQQATPELPIMPECVPYWRGKVPGIY